MLTPVERFMDNSNIGQKHLRYKIDLNQPGQRIFIRYMKHDLDSDFSAIYMYLYNNIPAILL